MGRRSVAAVALIASSVGAFGVVGATDAAAGTATSRRFTDYCTFAKAVEKTNAAFANPTLQYNKTKFKRAWLALRAVDKRIPAKLPVKVRAAWKVVLASDAKLTAIYEKYDYAANKAFDDPEFKNEIGPAERAALKTIAEYHASACGLKSSLDPGAGSG